MKRKFLKVVQIVQDQYIKDNEDLLESEVSENKMRLMNE